MFTAVPIMPEAKRGMATGQHVGKADLFSVGTLATAPNGTSGTASSIDRVATKRLVFSAARRLRTSSAC